MAKPTNSGTPPSGKDVAHPRGLAEGNTTTRIIGLKLGRTPGAVNAKASQEGISLKPTNQSPYNRRRKP